MAAREDTGGLIAIQYHQKLAMAATHETEKTFMSTRSPG